LVISSRQDEKYAVARPSVRLKQATFGSPSLHIATNLWRFPLM
jgi:hypothetical protein